MAQSTKGVSVDTLQHVSRWLLGEGALKAASRAIDDYHHKLSIAETWGDGRTSSSDGQRFGVQRSTLLAAFYPRYFGYYDRAITVYTHQYFASMRAVRNFLERAVSFPNVDFASTPQITFHSDVPREAVVFALLDTHRQTFNTALEGPVVGDWFGVVQGVDSNRAEVVLSRVATSPVREEPCKGPRNRLEWVDAPEVAGTVGNETRRRLCIHLPVDYEGQRERRYPVVYVLPGYPGDDRGGTVRLVFRAADDLPAPRQAIFVGVNIQNKMGPSYLVRSPMNGDFETFMTQTITTFIDDKYRTIARASARALIGQSTGGFDAISIALRHSDRFGVVAESSADGPDFGSWMLTPDGHHLVPLMRDLLRLEDTFGPLGQMSAYAADWSPDATAPRGFRWPANPATGEIIPEVWQRWLAQSPSELIKNPSILQAAREHLSGKILLAAGATDEFDLYAPAKRFGDELTAAGVRNQFVSDEKGHDGGPARFKELVAFVIDHLDGIGTHQ